MRNAHGCVFAVQASLLRRLLRPVRSALFVLPIIAVWLYVMPQPALAQTPVVIYVDHDASGVNSGTSWTDAYTDLQDALGDPAASTKEIWVAEGVYLPTSVTTDRSATFRLASGVEVYGGFAATETLRIQRNWMANLTVLSGDIDENDANKLTGVTQSYDDIRGSNSYHVVSAGPEADATAALDGFTVTGGYANGSTEQGRGGGIYCTGCSAALSQLVLAGNWGNAGGGILAYPSSSVLQNVIITGNGANNGAGLYSSGGGLTLRNVAIHHNAALLDGGGGYASSSAHSLDNVTMCDNSASSEGGGLYLRGTSSPIIRNSILWNNLAESGPQIHNAVAGLVISYSDVQESGGSGATWPSSLGVDGGGNIDDSPFVGNGVGVYLPPSGSPAIDAGDPITATLSSLDLDGNLRVVDGDGLDGPRVDMGAYEWPGYGLTLHVDGQGEVSSLPSGTHFPPNANVTLTAVPADGWDFAGWSGDATGADLTTQVTMTASKIVTATFTSPSAVTMGSFSARSTPSGMLLTWETATEIDMLGVTLRRRTLPVGPWVDLNRGEMIPVQGPGQLLGASYSYLDADVRVGEHYTYLLEMVGFGPLASGPDAIHTVDARYWDFFWWLPILGGHAFSGP